MVDLVPFEIEKNTIESKRKADETIVEDDDAEVEWDEQNDELDSYFSEEQEPKVRVYFFVKYSDTVSNPIWLHRFWLHLAKKNEMGQCN